MAKHIKSIRHQNLAAGELLDVSKRALIDIVADLMDRVHGPGWDRAELAVQIAPALARREDAMPPYLGRLYKKPTNEGEGE